jgi:ethanolamine utilization cobalamin adenosyltransferase
MRVERVSSAYDTLRPHMYYAGTHLVQYSPSHYQDLAKARAERSNKKEHEPSSNEVKKSFEQHFVEQQQVEKKDLIKRLNYVSGVHYSQLNKFSNGA